MSHPCTTISLEHNGSISRREKTLASCHREQQLFTSYDIPPKKVILTVVYSVKQLHFLDKKDTAHLMTHMSSINLFLRQTSGAVSALYFDKVDFEKTPSPGGFTHLRSTYNAILFTESDTIGKVIATPVKFVVILNP